MSSHTWLPETGLGPEPATVREVVAIRPGGLAAVVHAVPALRHLRSTYARARISVAAGGPARELLDACPYVDRSIDIDHPSEALLERFDVALSFAAPGRHGALDVDQVDAAFRASWRSAGVAARRAIHPEWPPRLADGVRMLRLAWLLGGEAPADPSLGLWPSLADRNAAARLVTGMERPLAVVHVGSTDPARRWPAERWARVLELVDGLGMSPVLVGTDPDAAASLEVVLAARVAPLDLVGRTSVGELAGLLERAALFIGSDSGPAALAGALGVRSVVVGPASPLEHSARPGLVDLVAAPSTCEQCDSPACLHEVSDASAVALDSVLTRVALAAGTARDRWRAERLA